MKRRRIIGIALALVTLVSLLPMSGLAAQEDPRGSYLLTNDTSRGASEYIVGLSISWNGNRDNMILSDVTNLRVTHNGNPVDVELVDVERYEWSNTGGESGVGFTFRFAMPLYELGDYELTYTYQGRNYSARPHTLTGDPPPPPDIDPNAESGSRNNPIQISNEAELRAFADRINSEPLDYSMMTWQYVTLTQDIELTGQWTPIGRYDNKGDSFREYAFFGVFNGDGHTISGVKIGTPDNPSTLENIGFFGIARGEIQNLSIEVEIYARCPEDQWQGVGGLAGTGGGSIYNSSVAGSIVTFDSGAYTWPRIGGIVADCDSAITNSRSSVDITLGAAAVAGGIAGGIRNSQLEDVGGRYYLMPGQAIIQNCVFDGRITSRSTHDEIGGIAGELKEGAEIRGCRSTGELRGTGVVGGLVGSCAECIISDSYSSGNVTGRSAGGLIGSIQYGYISEYDFTLLDSYPGSSIENCFATGNVAGESGDGWGGGVGGLIGSIDWSENKPLVIRYCHASGDVLCAEGFNANAGGFIGSANIFRGSIENCYATGDVEGGTCGGFAANLNSQRQRYENGTIGGGDPTYGTLSVSRCFSSGNATATQSAAGGFAASTEATVTDCAALGNVISAHIAYGFAALSTYGRPNSAEVSIDRCFASGDVRAIGERSFYSYAFGSGENITDCYASGNAGGVGLAVAFEHGRNCYYFGVLEGVQGGYVYHYSDFVNSYCDITVFPEGNGSATGKSTAELQSPAFVDLLNAGRSGGPWLYIEDEYPALASLRFHSVEANGSQNGRITVSTDTAFEGLIIVAYAEPDEGYQLKSVFVDGSIVDGLSFTMPGSNVSVRAEFEPVPEETNSGAPQGGGSLAPGSGSGSSGSTQGSGGGGTTEPGETPGLSGVGSETSGNPQKSFTVLIIICGAVALLCLVAVVVFVIINRKRVKNNLAGISNSVSIATLAVAGAAAVAMLCLIFIPIVIRSSETSPMPGLSEEAASSAESHAPSSAPSVSPAPTPDNGGNEDEPTPASPAAPSTGTPTKEPEDQPVETTPEIEATTPRFGTSSMAGEYFRCDSCIYSLPDGFTCMSIGVNDNNGQYTTSWSQDYGSTDGKVFVVTEYNEPLPDFYSSSAEDIYHFVIPVRSYDEYTRDILKEHGEIDGCPAVRLTFYQSFDEFDTAAYYENWLIATPNGGVVITLTNFGLDDYNAHSEWARSIISTVRVVDGNTDQQGATDGYSPQVDLPSDLEDLLSDFFSSPGQSGRLP